MAGKKEAVTGKKEKGGREGSKKKEVKRQEKQAKSSEIKEIRDADFESLVKENDAVLIDFFAEWCMPCVMMVPVVEELAKTFAGKVVFAKISIDENHKTASDYKIMSVPTLLIFKKGALVERIIGALSYDMLKEKINECLGMKTKNGKNEND